MRPSPSPRRALRFAGIFFAAVCITLAPSAWVSAAGSPALISKAAPLRVMALGDSITAGVGAAGIKLADGGYRGTLAKLLQDSGYHVKFVGSRSDFSSAIPERAHEGWPGYVVRSFPSDPGPGELLGALTRSAIRDADPDIILLMAGTNDLLRLQKHADGYTLPAIVHSMDLLVDQIFTQKPDVRVIVAPVVASTRIDRCTIARFAGEGACGQPGAETLKTLVAAYAKRGFRISLASAMESAVPADASHFPDGIHPAGADGYGLVAKIWLDAIEAVTEASPEMPSTNH
ncbi:MAG: GDSL-type esterase/lipase family protein [Candidatus Velthaea sp.]